MFNSKLSEQEQKAVIEQAAATIDVAQGIKNQRAMDGDDGATVFRSTLGHVVARSEDEALTAYLDAHPDTPVER